MIQNDPEGSEMLQEALECLKIFQNVLGYSRIFYDV